MFPEVLNAIMVHEDENAPIDECRVAIVDSQLQITHHREISIALADAILKNRNTLLKNIKEIIPECINFNLLPSTKGKSHVKCSTFTLQVNVKHNTVDEINTLADMAQVAHEAVLKSLQRDIILKNIHEDMKPFRDEE